MKVIVDNVSVLAVESCVISKLPSILSPETILSLDEQTIHNIAAETENSVLERQRTTGGLKTLKEGLKALTEFSRPRFASGESTIDICALETNSCLFN